MKAAAGFMKAISQVMPALMTFSMMKSLMPPMTSLFEVADAVLDEAPQARRGLRRSGS